MIYPAVFTASVDWVLGQEGVLSDDLADDGGLTRYGHDSASWCETLGRMPPNVAANMPRSVISLTRDQAIAAYYWAYWIFFHCDRLTPAFALLTFDAAVNGGHPIAWLQHAVGTIPDGILGPATLHAMQLLTKEDGLAEAIAEFQAWHLAYLTDLSKWTTFGATNGRPFGWARRAFTMCLDALRIEEEFGSLARG